MGHRIPVVAVGKMVGKRDFVKHKPRWKWKNNDGRRKQGIFPVELKVREPVLSQQKSYGSARCRELKFSSASHRLMRRDHRSPPEAPRNTTSYIIRSKCVEGIAPVVTPSPVTPAVLPTPGLSPLPRYKEQFADEVNEWGVNGYGSMNGLIRLKTHMKEESEAESESDRSSHAESVQQLEQRLDQDLNRFEIVYPSANVKPQMLEVRLVNQEYHIAQLEEENYTLKERLCSIEQELDDLRNHMQMLEGGSGICGQGEVSSEKSIGNEEVFQPRQELIP